MSDTLDIYDSNYNRVLQSIVDKNGFFDLRDVDPSSLSYNTQEEVTPLFYISITGDFSKGIFSIANIVINAQQFKDSCLKYDFMSKYSMIAACYPSSTTLEDYFDGENYTPASLHLEMNSDDENIKPYVYVVNSGGTDFVAAVIPSPYNFVTPTDGRQFLGWSTSEGGNVEYQTGDIVEREENQPFPELYAIWQDSQQHIIGNITGAQSVPSDTQILNSVKSKFIGAGLMGDTYTEIITLENSGIYYLRCYDVSSYTITSPTPRISTLTVEKEQQDDDDLIIQTAATSTSQQQKSFRIISYGENKKIKLTSTSYKSSTSCAKSLCYTLLGPF